MRIEAIASLIPIHLYFQKLSVRLQLRTFSLPSNHTIKSLLEKGHTSNSLPYLFSLKNMTSKQWSKIKSLITNTNICLNGVFSFFDFLSSEFSSGSRLIDIFSSYFSFYKANCHNLSGTVHIRNESLQDRLRDMQTCGITLALAYVLCCLSIT